MKASIEVFRDGDAFSVTVSEATSQTRHLVTAKAADLSSLAPGAAPERVIEAAFRFLLDREPKESILSAFDLSVIAGYFPEFERELAGYLPRPTYRSTK